MKYLLPAIAISLLGAASYAIYSTTADAYASTALGPGQEPQDTIATHGSELRTANSTPARNETVRPQAGSTAAKIDVNHAAKPVILNPPGIDNEFRLAAAIATQQMLENQRDADRNDKEIVRMEMHGLMGAISGVLHAQGRTILETPEDQARGGFTHTKDGFDHVFSAHLGLYRFYKGEFPAYDEIRARFLAMELEQPVPALSDGYFEGVQLICQQAVDALSNLN